MWDACNGLQDWSGNAGKHTGKRVQKVSGTVWCHTTDAQPCSHVPGRIDRHCNSAANKRPFKLAFLTGAAAKAIVQTVVSSSAQQENEAHTGSIAGIYGAQIPTIVQLHHQAHAVGARARMNSQPNPFSRAARASSFSRKSTGLPAVASFTTDCAHILCFLVCYFLSVGLMLVPRTFKHKSKASVAQCFSM